MCAHDNKIRKMGNNDADKQDEEGRINKRNDDEGQQTNFLLGGADQVNPPFFQRKTKSDHHNSLSRRLVDDSNSTMRKTIEEITTMSAWKRNRIHELMHGVLDHDSDSASLLLPDSKLQRRTRQDETARLMSSFETSSDYSSVDWDENHRHEEASRLLSSFETSSDYSSIDWDEDHPARAFIRDDIDEPNDQDHELGVAAGKGSPLHPPTMAPWSSKIDGKVASRRSELEDVERTREEQEICSDDGYRVPGDCTGYDVSHPGDGPKRNRTLSIARRRRFLLEKLQELDDAIGKIQWKAGYNQAHQIHDGYIDNPKFRLMFLRAESFDAKKAACRLVSFLDEKLHRFGPSALTRQLTLDDLSRTSKSLMLKKGVLQVLPRRDSVGRAILVTFYDYLRLQDELHRQPSSLGDAIFYLLSVMAEDQETQHRGIVTVGIIMSPPWQVTEKAAEILVSSLKDIGSTIERWCPIQCNAHHYWIYDDSEKNNQDSRANIPCPRPTAASNSMTGSFVEYQQSLKTFGIETRSLPYLVDGSGILVTGALTKWIQKRKQKEKSLILNRKRRKKGTRSTSTIPTPTDMLVEFEQQQDVPTKRQTSTNTMSCFDVIDIPGRHDVCLGGGTGLNQHVGNVAMRAMMGPLVHEYNTATSSRRHELNKIIVQAIHLLGGRFLTNDQATERAWFTVESNNNIEKSIASIFRSMVSRMNATHRLLHYQMQPKIE